MKYISPILIVILLTITLYTPKVEAVVHFGGSITKIQACINKVIYARLGPPRGGPYLWSPSVTKTYQFGPPKHTGQWLLGNAGPSYFCLVRTVPVVVWPGLLMIMMGSSK